MKATEVRRSTRARSTLPDPVPQPDDRRLWVVLEWVFLIGWAPAFFLTMPLWVHKVDGVPHVHWWLGLLLFLVFDISGISLAAWAVKKRFGEVPLL